MGAGDKPSTSFNFSLSNSKKTETSKQSQNIIDIKKEDTKQVAYAEKATTNKQAEQKEERKQNDIIAKLAPKLNKPGYQPLMDFYSDKFPGLTGDKLINQILNYISSSNERIKEYINVIRDISFNEAKSGDTMYLQDYLDTLNAFLKSGLLSQSDYLDFQDELKNFETELGTYEKIEPETSLELGGGFEKTDDGIYVVSNDSSNTMIEFDSPDSPKGTQTKTCKKGDFSIQYDVYKGQVNEQSLEEKKVDTIAKYDNQIDEFTARVDTFDEKLDRIENLKSKGVLNLDIDDKKFILEDCFGLSISDAEKQLDAKFPDEVFEQAKSKLNVQRDEFQDRLNEAQNLKSNKEAEFDERIEGAKDGNRKSTERKTLQESKDKYTDKIINIIDYSNASGYDGEVLKKTFLEIGEHYSSYGLQECPAVIKFMENPQKVDPDPNDPKLNDEMKKIINIAHQILLGENSKFLLNGDNRLKSTGEHIDMGEFQSYIEANRKDYPGLNKLKYHDKMSKSLMDEILKLRGIKESGEYSSLGMNKAIANSICDHQTAMEYPNHGEAGKGEYSIEHEVAFA